MIDAGTPETMSVPSLSVVLVTAGSFGTVRKIVRCLQAQTICDQIELLIAVRSGAAFCAEPDVLSGFKRHEIIEIGEPVRVAVAKTTAVGRATAPVIAFTEDHCFPEPGWAEALLAAHNDGWAGVGPAVRNANPGTAISRTAYLMHWASWMDPVARGPAQLIAWHNSSYRRTALMEVSGDLPGLFLVENFLQAALRDRGHHLYVEPAACVSHVNMSRPGPWMAHGFWGGRLYAARRVSYERSSLLQRAKKVASCPVVPLVRMWRLLRLLRRDRRLGEFMPRTLPLLAVGLLTHAAGEAAGYLLGEGDAESHYSEFELFRQRDVLPSELPLLT